MTRACNLQPGMTIRGMGTILSVQLISGRVVVSFVAGLVETSFDPMATVMVSR